MAKKSGEAYKFQWNTIQVTSNGKVQEENDKLLSGIVSTVVSDVSVTNPTVPITNGIRYETNFITNDEESVFIEEIQNLTYIWEGFDQRRRVQRYDLQRSHNSNNNNVDNNDEISRCCSSNPIPDCILTIAKRIEEQFGHRPQHASVEEYVAENTIRSKGEFASNYTVTTYESTSTSFMLPNSTHVNDTSSRSISSSVSSTWFVAQIPLRMEAYQHCNQPKQRNVNCWTLQSPNHTTDVKMDQRSIIIKTDDFLLNWRSRVAAIPLDMIQSSSSSFDEYSDSSTSKNSQKSTLILRFYNLPTDEKSNDNGQNTESDEFDNYGYRPSNSDYVPSNDTPLPPLEKLLTIIITTSPIRSNPTTELLEKAMETFLFGGSSFAYKCRKVIVCDGCRIRQENNELNEHGHRKVTNKHTNVKQAMRNGIVNTEQAEKYEQYKERLKQLCTDANTLQNGQSPFCNTIVVELDERHGYGFALRHVLQNCTETQFVCVIQHDRTFMRPTPIQETVHAMWRHPNIKYVGMSMRSNLLYRDLFLGKYGRMYQKEFDDSIICVPELVADATKYGPNSESTTKMTYDTEKLQKNIQSFAETYRASAQGEISHAINTSTSDKLVDGRKRQMILTPTLFWYDNVHICETVHYRDFIFKPSYKMVARGGFVEDKLSPVIKRTVERLGFKDGHSRFGCYLLDDGSGMFFTGHLDGGSYLTSAAKDEIRAACSATSTIVSDNTCD